MQPFRPSMLATLCALTMVLASGTARGDMISDVQQLLGDRGGKLVWTSNHGTNNYEIWMMDFRDCKRVRLTDHPYTDTMPIWSPDGTHIAWKRALGVSSDVHGTKGGTIWVMRADGSGARKVASLPNDSHTSSRLHFWGNHWITYRGSGGVRRVNITTGQTELIARIDKFNASLAPDGRFMNLATQGTGGIGMVDMSTGKWTFLVDGCNNSIAPDSTYRFMHLSMGHKDFVVRSRTGKVAKRLGPPAGTAYVHAPLFSNHPDFCAHAVDTVPSR